MNNELDQVLQTDYGYALDAQKADFEEAGHAKTANAMDAYFDLNQVWQLADLCWAMEKWEDAKKWYRHNAAIILEKRKWLEQNPRPGYPLDAVLDKEAGTFIKAGDLDNGTVFLKKAVAFFSEDTGSELILGALGLYAAQAGDAEWTQLVQKTILARQDLCISEDDAVKKMAGQLNYEIPQVHLMMGQKEEFTRSMGELMNTVNEIEDKKIMIFPPALQNALLHAAYGLQVIQELQAGEQNPETLQRGIEHFEKAMLNFYRFNNSIDEQVYFMRLDTRFCHELAEGKPVNPNPFAGGEKN